MLNIMRRFVPNPNGKGLVRRAEVKPAVPLRSVGDCLVCLKPLMVAVGQRIRFHKECRTEGRKRFGKATHNVEVDIRGNLR